MPKLTVLLPTYNNSRTIMAAVNSILAQSYTDFELLVINDGSTDNTLAQLAAIDDARLHIIGGATNIGLPRRLNEGIAAAQGLYIARMDADDIALPTRFEKQVVYLDAHTEIDVLGARAVMFDDAGGLYGLLPFAATHAELTKRPWNNIPLPHPTWVMRRDWVSRYLYAVPEVWRAEDQDLLLRAHKSSSYACLAEVLLCYRVGKFDFKKSFLARKSLFSAQLRYFMAQRDYMAVVLSGCIFTAKILKDIKCLYVPSRTESVAGIAPDTLAMIKKMVSQS